MKGVLEAESSSSGSSSCDDGTAGTQCRSRRNRRHDNISMKFISSRKTPFTRLEMIDEAEHRRRHFAQRELLRSAELKTSSTGLSVETNGNLSHLHASTDESASSVPSPDPEIILSPKITLSAESPERSTVAAPPWFRNPSRKLSRLDGMRPASLAALHSPISEDSFAPESEARSTGPSSPITLLSPQPIPAPGSMSSTPSLPAQVEMHGDVLIRLVYTFCTVHPKITYNSGLLEILAPLYLISACGNLEAAKKHHRRKPVSEFAFHSLERWAEAQTFWAFTSLMEEFSGLISLSPIAGHRGKDAEWALDHLGRRIRWADDRFWTILRQRNLDPASPLYAYRWMTHLFSLDCSSRELGPLWDFLLSEPPATVTEYPRLDLLIDLCAAMLLSVKGLLLRPSTTSTANGKILQAKARGASLWTDLNIDENNAPMPDDDEVFVRGLQLLRSFPWDQCGGVEPILQKAFELRQARLMVDLSEDDPDALPRVVTAASSSWSIRSVPTLSSSIRSLTRAESDSIAPEASTRRTASAISVSVSTTNAIKTRTSMTEATQTGIGSMANRLWTSMRPSSASREDYAASPQIDSFSPLPPLTPHSNPRRDKQLHLESQEGTTRHSTDPPPSSVAPQRYRSDSSASAVSTSSLQERLSNLVSGQRSPPQFTHNKQASLQLPSVPKPLLLSGSARRASGPSQSQSRRLRRDSSPISTTVSPAASPPIGTLSPPQAILGQSADRNPISSGLYRIGSRQSLSRSYRSPVLIPQEGSPIRELDYGDDLEVAAI